MTQPIPSMEIARGIAESYERYFVPSIGAPVAEDLMEVASLRPGDRVLDVACGTGVIARLAARAVGDEGQVAGLDLNAGMIEVAREGPMGSDIEWYVSPAESMPLPDASFDVAICQMGLPFMPDKAACLRETWRVLVPGGRLVLNTPGPIPAAMKVLEEGLARHIGPEIAGFARIVFSLHDAGELQQLVSEAGFVDVTVGAASKTLRLPPPKDFLWQYLKSTPLSNALANADKSQLDALERDVCERWEEMVEDGALLLTVRMSTVTARKPV